ncbi:MAG: caspase family protein [Deltaproteobacteria bacterium]|nr:caspase family protein [Deltaproteobacteria bacterium]
MRRLLVAVCGAGATLAALAASPAAATEEGPLRVALVIGNNQAPTADVEALRYADDDALATAELLIEAGVHTVVLTRMDDETWRLHQQAAPFDAPTPAALTRAVLELGRAVAPATAAGRGVELLFFYSGHGDVERGEGRLALEGGRLTRRALHEQVIAPLAPTASHVIIDACRSSFMAYARGPGGRRAAAPAGFSRPEVATRVGYVLSTSSERDSHEWQGFQAGVFSHEVRSALRGAADADLDAHISYAELGAFLATANAGIANERFRPDVLLLPPAKGPEVGALDEVVLAWPPGSSLLVDEGRSHVEDEQGRRLLDVPPAATPLLVRLPLAQRLFVSSGGHERVLEAGASTLRASELPEAPRTVAARGAAHDAAFRVLFSAPFGAEEVARYRARPAPALPEASMPPLAVAAWSALGVASACALGAAVAEGVGWGVYASAADAPQIERAEANETIGGLNLAAAIGAGVAVVGGASAVALFVVDGVAAGAAEEAP